MTIKDLMTSSANHYAKTRSREELLRLAQETKDDIDRETLLKAVDIQNGVYGVQLALELK